jgi:membrane protein DedA with SNARE-associated domain
LAKTITSFIHDYGYLAIFLLMALDSACIPVSSEVVMLFGGAAASAQLTVGALSGQHPLNFWLVVLAGVAGSMVGSWAAYGVGYAGGRPLIDRWGRYILLRPHEVDRAHAWFEKHGDKLVFFGRLIPVLRTFISLPAGVAKMDLPKFSLYTFFGVVPWTIGFAFVGWKLGESWRSVERYLKPISYTLGVALLMLVVWWVVKRLRERRSETAAAD